MENTYYWHDYETWGEVPTQDRPSQFAGVRTDADLNIIGEPLMIYCQPTPDYLPKPEACLVTGITPQYALEHGVPEPEFMAKILTEFSRPKTCGVGYNSIRFDDEVTRFSLYRNFHDPYEREWRNGNSRWDIIDMVRMTRALRPDGIEWPNYEDGTPCFKLEVLSKANGLEHNAAHDALSDVYATIALAKLIKEKQPKLFDYAYRLRNKRFAAEHIDIESHKPVLHISSMFPSEQGNCALMLPLMYHPTNKNSVIAYNLSVPPRDLLACSAEEIANRLFVKKDDLPEGVERIALKDIHLNKTPMLLPVKMLDDATAERLQFNKAACRENWKTLSNLTLQEQAALKQKLADVYTKREFEKKTDPEQMLYDGFIEDGDKALIKRVHKSHGEQLTPESFVFTDKRLAPMLWRYRARNFPHVLTREEQSKWKEFCYKRLTDPALGASIVKTELDSRIQALYETCDEKNRAILQSLSDYANDLINWTKP